MALEAERSTPIPGDETGSFSDNAEQPAEPRTFSRIVLTQVQRGTPSRVASELGVRGRPMLAFMTSPTLPSIVRQSLEFFDRSGRLRIWVDGVDVTGLEEPPAGPEMPQASAAAPIENVEVAGLRQRLEDAHAQLRTLDAQTTAAQRFLELLLTEIERAQERTKKVVGALEETTKTSQANADAVQDKTWQHTRSQLGELYGIETASVQKLNELAREALATLGVSAQLQQAMRANLKPETWRDALNAAKDLVQVVVQGPVAMLTNSVMQSMVARHRGHDVHTAQILDAQVLAGEAARSRWVHLRTTLHALVPHAVTQTAAVVADYLEGQVALEVVVHVLQTHLNRATVVQGR